MIHKTEPLDYAVFSPLRLNDKKWLTIFSGQVQF